MINSKLKIVSLVVLLTVLIGESASASDWNRYFRELSEKEESRFSDIVICLNHLVKGPVERDFKVQLEYLKKRGIIDEGAPDDPGVVISRGTAAVLFCRALKIRGGLMMRLFPGSQRYSLRELVHLGLVGQGNINDVLSGADLVILLSRAADYRKEHYL